MPFTPLPGIFSADLTRCGPLDLLELGSGDGAFTAVLRDHGVEALTLDRGVAATGCRARIRGDALAPPLRRPFEVVVAANLLRHLWRDLAASGPGAWRDLVAPGGCLWILEDAPGEAPDAVRNYRDLQSLLARLAPGSRGPLLGRRRFEARRDAWRWPGAWRGGECANEWVVNADEVADWLATGITETGGEVDRLVRSIRSEGLAYGRYWWARWQAEDAA